MCLAVHATGRRRPPLLPRPGWTPRGEALLPSVLRVLHLGRRSSSIGGTPGTAARGLASVEAATGVSPAPRRDLEKAALSCAARFGLRGQPKQPRRGRPGHPSTCRAARVRRRRRWRRRTPNSVVHPGTEPKPGLSSRAGRGVASEPLTYRRRRLAGQQEPARLPTTRSTAAGSRRQRTHQGVERRRCRPGGLLRWWSCPSCGLHPQGGHGAAVVVVVGKIRHGCLVQQAPARSPATSGVPAPLPPGRPIRSTAAVRAGVSRVRPGGRTSPANPFWARAAPAASFKGAVPAPMGEGEAFQAGAGYSTFPGRRRPGCRAGHPVLSGAARRASGQCPGSRTGGPGPGGRHESEPEVGPRGTAGSQDFAAAAAAAGPGHSHDPGVGSRGAAGRQYAQVSTGSAGGQGPTSSPGGVVDGQCSGDGDHGAARHSRQFAVLAGSGITNTGATTIKGDVGSSPTPSQTGFAPCPAANCVTLTGRTTPAPPPMARSP